MISKKERTLLLHNDSHHHPESKISVIKQYIKESASRVKKNLKSFHMLNGKVLVTVKDTLPKDFNIQATFKAVESRLPEKLFFLIDHIIIGDHPIFKQKKVNAYYRENTLFITPDQKDSMDMVDDIIHEIAHVIEDHYHDQIYGDRAIEEEFLTKRALLLDILKQSGYINKEDIKLFKGLKFNDVFDNLLYKKIGYPVLSKLITNLFLGPYSITSIREYFAVAFEEYFTDYIGAKEARKVCPEVFKKIKMLENYFDEES